MSSEFYNAVGSVATAIAAIASVLAVIVAVRTVKYASDQAQILSEQLTAAQVSLQLDIHARFQSDFRAIQRGFSSEVNKPNWIPTDSERRNISLYWYFVFDEWMTCKKMHLGVDHLWDQLYSGGVHSALLNAAFRDGLNELLLGGSKFLGHAEEFRNEINRLAHPNRV